jgi:hypothetical protein
MVLPSCHDAGIEVGSAQGVAQEILHGVRRECGAVGRRELLGALAGEQVAERVGVVVPAVSGPPYALPKALLQPPNGEAAQIGSIERIGVGIPDARATKSLRPLGPQRTRSWSRQSIAEHP